ncbi:MAG: response regulator [Acidimicrobiales bacterium]
MAASRRIVVVDDHPLLVLALCAELERSGVDVSQLDPHPGIDVLVEAITADPPDCAVVDLGLPFPGGGIALVEPLAARQIRVAVLTGETDRHLLAGSAQAGAEVVLSKAEALDNIVDTILAVAAGRDVRPSQRGELAAEFRQLSAEQHRRQAPFDGLSPREREVLAGLMDGDNPKVLAERNYVSVATVRSQVKSVLSKLGVSSQLEAVAMAHRSHWEPTRDEP